MDNIVKPVTKTNPVWILLLGGCGGPPQEASEAIMLLDVHLCSHGSKGRNQRGHHAQYFGTQIPNPHVSQDATKNMLILP